MHEWTLQSGSRKSTSTEKPFNDGQKVRSILCLDEEGALRRLDFHPEETVPLEGVRPVARWVRVFRSNETERELEREAIQTSEELFLSLMEEGDGTGEEDSPEAAATRGILRFLLALQLERKRVLRRVGRMEVDGTQCYRHPKTNTEYQVPVADLEAERLRAMKEQLGEVLG